MASAQEQSRGGRECLGWSTRRLVPVDRPERGECLGRKQDYRKWCRWIGVGMGGLQIPPGRRLVARDAGKNGVVGLGAAVEGLLVIDVGLDALGDLDDGHMVKGMLGPIGAIVFDCAVVDVCAVFGEAEVVRCDDVAL